MAIIRRFAPGGVHVRYEIRDRLGALLDAGELASGAWIVIVSHDFRKSRWNGNTLEILDGAGRVTAGIPCDAYAPAHDGSSAPGRFDG